AGQPLSEYILQVRITLAKRLLEETELKIYEIAEKTGFCTPGYFTRVFRGAEGRSPKAYRLAAGWQESI
ncbi:MAG: helix-turn-helix transcriptional regulator, partial [Acetatifactor sp.]|nr:helix-turn-helix transcriptional regulator [Acetatifactor sp.]